MGIGINTISGGGADGNFTFDTPDAPPPPSPDAPSAPFVFPFFQGGSGPQTPDIPPPPASPQPNGPVSLPLFLTPPIGGASPSIGGGASPPPDSPSAPTSFTFFGHRRRSLQGDAADGSDGDGEEDEQAEGALGVEGVGQEGPVEVGGGGVGVERRELLAQDELQAALEVRGDKNQSRWIGELASKGWCRVISLAGWPALAIPASTTHARIDCAPLGRSRVTIRFFTLANVSTHIRGMHGLSHCQHGGALTGVNPPPATHPQGRSVRLVLTSGPEARETSSAAAAEALSLFNRELQVGVCVFVCVLCTLVPICPCVPQQMPYPHTPCTLYRLLLWSYPLVLLLRMPTLRVCPRDQRLPRALSLQDR